MIINMYISRNLLLEFATFADPSNTDLPKYRTRLFFMPLIKIR